MKYEIFLNTSGVQASGIYDSETGRVLIKKGSQIRKIDEKYKSFYGRYEKIYNELINNDDFISNYVFLKDYEFSSLSNAASVLTGRTANGRLEFKLVDGRSIAEIFPDETDILTYLNNNLEKYGDYVFKANEESNYFKQLYPLERLSQLPINLYDKVGSVNSFMNLLERRTKSLGSGHLGINTNKLFYNRKSDFSYGTCDFIINNSKYINKSLEEIYSIYIRELADFIRSFDVTTYNSKKDYPCKDFIHGANIIKMKIILLYRGSLFTSFNSLDMIRKMLDYLGISYGVEEDSIELNIKFTDYLYNLDSNLKNYSLYQISACLWDYYNKYVKQNEENYYAVGFYIDDEDRKKDFFDKKVFAIGWNKLGSLDNYDNDEDIVNKAMELYGDKEVHINQTLSYFKSFNVGDTLVLKSSFVKNKKGCSRIYAIGKVVDSFENSYEYIPNLGHTIKVEWEELNPSLDIEDTAYRKTISLIRNREFKNRIKNILKKEPTQNNEVGTNIIYYGVPGCGKSFYANQKAEKLGSVERILFHPEYTYSDFVGQILPSLVDGRAVYKFVPGPFTKILCKALNDEKNHFCLVIEEINRGNASAIFGDIFQLLDRLRYDKEGYKKGESEYRIKNDLICDYLKEEIDGYEDEEIYIPANLTIIATMNSSDQNVFPLDTAFKRRWIFKKISNEFEDTHKYKDLSIVDTNVSWEEFVIKINEKISELSFNGINGDDKQIGKYFLSEEEIRDADLFAEKVLLYLWEDVVKFNRSLLFKDEYNNLDSLIEGFRNNKLKVFKDLFENENV